MLGEYFDQTVSVVIVYLRVFYYSHVVGSCVVMINAQVSIHIYIYFVPTPGLFILENCFEVGEKSLAQLVCAF